MIAAIIVLYHQSVEEVMQRISGWMGEVGYILLVDNTEGLPVGRKVLSERVDYSAFGENRGIAFALNYGMEECIRRGFRWVLTMDQDSCFVTSLKPYEELIASSGAERVGLFYPLYEIGGVRVKSPEKRVLQSGSLVNADCWKLVGGYEERYFIDYVDYDYCARLLGTGCRIQNVSEVILFHKPGNKIDKSLWEGGKTSLCVNCSHPLLLYGPEWFGLYPVSQGLASGCALSEIRSKNSVTRKSKKKALSLFLARRGRFLQETMG